MRVPFSEEWLNAVRKSQSVLLFSHIHPDGDTVGSVLALRRALLAMGKQVQVVCDGTPSPRFGIVPDLDVYRTPEQIDAPYDTAFSVDVSSPDMLGEALPLFEKAATRIVLDHHGTNPAFGDFNYVESNAPACCQLAYKVIVRDLGIPLDTAMANQLLLGLSTDTGHFQYNGTKPETLRAAADLLEHGGQISLISRKMYRSFPMSKVKLTKRAYEAMSFHADNQIGMIILTKEDFDCTGCSFEEADGLVNKALEVDGVRMSFMASEREDGIKISLRAVEPDTVNDVAVRFGGGGHPQAAGCTIHATLQEAADIILAALKEKV